jgi:hypothetical protein
MQIIQIRTAYSIQWVGTHTQSAALNFFHFCLRMGQ